MRENILEKLIYLKTKAEISDDIPVKQNKLKSINFLLNNYDYINECHEPVYELTGKEFFEYIDTTPLMSWSMFHNLYSTSIRDENGEIKEHILFGTWHKEEKYYTYNLICNHGEEKEIIHDAKVVVKINTDTTIDDVGVICEKCNKIIPLDKINIVREPVRTDISRKLFYNENKIAISRIQMSRIKAKHETVITKCIDKKFTFNLETGRTYRLYEFDTNAKKAVNKKQSPFCAISLKEPFNYKDLIITVNEMFEIGYKIEKCVNDPDIIPFDEYVDTYIKELTNAKKHRPISEDIYENNDKCLFLRKIEIANLLIAYNTNPFVHFKVLNSMYNLIKSTNKFKVKIIRNKNVENDMKSFLVNKLNCPKMFTKYVTRSYSQENVKEQIKIFNIILDCRIQDINNKYKIVKAITNSNEQWFYTAKTMLNFINSDYYLELIKTHKEKDVVNAMLKFISRNHILTDSFLLFNRIKKKMPNYELPLKRLRLDTLHDLLNKDNNKLNNLRYKFEYAKDTKERFNEVVDKYNFILAETSDELTEVGSKMHICVGSYSPYVARKECIIVYVKEDNEYVGCIEINPSLTHVEQVKHIRNKYFEGDLLEAFNKYADKVKLNTYECYDLCNIDDRIKRTNDDIDLSEMKIYQAKPEIVNDQIIADNFEELTIIDEDDYIPAYYGG